MTLRGSRIRASCEIWMPMIARLASSGAATVLTVRSIVLPSAAGRADRLARRDRPDRGDEPAGRQHRLSRSLDDHVAALRVFAAGTSIATASTAPAGRGVDVEPRLPERDGRGDLLRALHVLPRLHAPLGEGLSGRGHGLAGTSVAPSGRRNGSSCSSRRAFRTLTSMK